MSCSDANNRRQLRRVLITINNPQAKGITRKSIKESISKLSSTVYYCVSDEVGAEGTPHCHIFLAFRSPVRWSTVQNQFPTAHIDPALGTAAQARDYVAKSGKWAASEKKETSIEGSFEEWGTLPEDHQGRRSDLDFLYQQIKSGASDYEILESNPAYLRHIGLIDKVRQAVAKENGKNGYRQLTVTYIQGKAGVGKTRFVMETYGYDHVYRVTDYKHPFDSYNGEPVICFDEFKDSIPVRDMLTYLEGYPLELPARYSNRWAAYEKVYIVSNTKLEDQYAATQYDDKEVWTAFLRRINTVSVFHPDGQRHDYTVAEYFSTIAKIPDNYENPFS